MSPHAARGAGTRHTVETVERGRERGWENCLGDELPRFEMQGNASCTYATLRYGTIHKHLEFDSCANVLTPLTSRGTQALFVVISVTLHLTAFNNCIAKMEVGCLKHPGASTIGSQLLDEDCSHGWQILATQP